MDGKRKETADHVALPRIDRAKAAELVEVAKDFVKAVLAVQ